MHQNSLRKKFIRGYNLPIHIFRDPYFGYLLELYEKDFGSLTKYNNFIDSLNQFSSPEYFFNDYDRVFNDMLEYINNYSVDVYDNLRYFDFESNVKGLPELTMKKNNVYSEDHHNQCFISVDIKQACYASLRYLNIVPDKTYEEFISRFTDIQFFKDSKQLRQMLFGHLNPKKQQQIQKMFIRMMLHLLCNDPYFINNFMNGKEIEAMCSGSDELLIYVDEDIANSLDLYIKDYLTDKFYDLFPFDVEIDVIKMIKINKECWIRHSFSNRKNELKAVPSYLYPQYYKSYVKNDRITDYDLYFVCDGRLSKFVETIGDK